MSENGLENFANVITVLAALGGVAVAWAGLCTWRREIESKLAANLLSLLREIEDAQHNVRLPWNTRDEIVEFALSPSQDRPTVVIMKRWQTAVHRRKEIGVTIEEAALRWGEQVSSSWNELEKTEFSLLQRIRLRDRAREQNTDEYLRLDAELSDGFNQDDIIRADISKPFNELRQLIGRKL